MGGESPAGEEVLADVMVSSGSYDRDHSIASFAYPADLPDPSGLVLVLRDSDGIDLPVQVDAGAGCGESGELRARFVLPQFAAGSQVPYQLVAVPGDRSANATAVDVGDAIALRIGEATAAEFRTIASVPEDLPDDLTSQQLNDIEISKRAGYLHPVSTPSGSVVTGDYWDDHAWHHGIWTAWTETRVDGDQVDFWNPWRYQGRVDLERVADEWSGVVHAGIDAFLRHDKLTTDTGGQVIDSTTVLEERWVVRAYKTHEGTLPYLVLDLESTQRVAPGVQFSVAEYHYGGFGLRGIDPWVRTNEGDAQSDQGFDFLTSEGHVQADGDVRDAEGDSVANRDLVANWVSLSGNAGQGPIGFAGFGHPLNFRAPQGVRLHPSEPYMSFTAALGGEFDILPDEPYQTCFRFVTWDGAPDPALLQRLWTDYTEPPSVTVVPP